MSSPVSNHPETHAPVSHPSDQPNTAPSTHHVGADHQKPHRVQLIKNHQYIRDGKKSYGHMLRKCTHIYTASIGLELYADHYTDNIKPTLDGPFTMIDEVVKANEGRLFPRIQDRMAGRPTHVAHRRLMRKDTSSGHVGEVDAQDVQQDSEYLAPVLVGTF